MQSLKDEEIIEAVLAGEIDDFEEIMKRYNEQFYRIALAFLKDQKDTEDVMQSAYLKIYEHLGQFNRSSAFGTWAIRILINECQTVLRKKRSAFEYLHYLANNFKRKMNSQSSETALINKELKQFIEKSILELPSKYRTIFMLREVNGYSTKETADILSISESNVKVRLHRAKEQVRNRIMESNKREVLFDFHLQKCNPFRRRVMTLIRDMELEESR